jgi:hypothetical protein
VEYVSRIYPTKMGDIVNANGLMVHGPWPRFEQGMGAVIVFEGEQLVDTLGEGLLGGRARRAREVLVTSPRARQAVTSWASQ